MKVRQGLGLLGICGGLLITAAGMAATGELKGEIKADGSSTVYLITEAMATNFKRAHPGVNISVGISGTGGGFKKFGAGETDISNASRPIKPPEIENCKTHGIEYVELQVAWDGLTVVIHPENTWAETMSVEQLKKLWSPGSTVKRWSELDPSWPNEEIQLYGAGPDSGTFDYFTEAINGKEKASRTDYRASEDDNVLVKGVAGNKYALGYFGFAYFDENRDKIKAVKIIEKPGAPAIAPSVESISTRTYRPLSRPMFIYVKKSSLKRPEVQEFVRFCLKRGDLVKASRYVQMNARLQLAMQERLDKALAGN
jgi:phosphate transport system substrate-binding protein